jgi:hypothetical protein
MIARSATATSGSQEANGAAPGGPPSRLRNIPAVGRRSLWVILVLSLAILALGFTPGVATLWLNEFGTFWDAQVYDRALSAFVAGRHPNADAPTWFPFLYLPLTLYAFQLIVVPALYFIPVATLAAGIVLSLRIARTRHAVAGFALWCASAFHGYFSVLTGNVTGLLHFAVLLYLITHALAGTSFTRLPGAVLIGLVAAVKPYMLATVLLFWIDGQASIQRKVGQTAVAGGVFVLINGLSYLLLPDLTMDYFRTILERSATTLDVGIGFFFGFLTLGVPRHLALAAHLVVWAVLALVVLRTTRTSTPVWRISMLYLLVVLLNPRMKQYDLMPALLPLVVLSTAKAGKLYKAYVIGSAATLVCLASIALSN